LTLCIVSCCLSKQTNQPLYGILTQPAYFKKTAFSRSRPSELSTSFILKMYDQMVTAAGGMTMAIPYDLPIRKLNEVLPYLNGILIADGYTGSKRDEEYSQRVSFITHWAQARNMEGEYFSIIAIDKGLHELMKASNGDESQLIECGLLNYNVSSNLALDKVILKDTKVLKTLSEKDLLYALTETNSVPFSHNCSVPVEKFKASMTLTAKFNLVATATKTGHPPFLALVEHKLYPFVGMQFRPGSTAFRTDKNLIKDRRIVSFYRNLISKFIFGGGSSNLKAINDLPMTIQNLLMYKDMPVLGYHNTGHIYIYRRWMAGRDIDIPTN